MKLIMYSAFADAILSFNLFSSYVICRFGLPELFAMTVLFQSPAIDQATGSQTSDWFEAKWKSLWILETAINFYSLLFLFFTINLNTCLAIDLILMFKHPFARKDDRLAPYIWTSFIIALALSVANIATVSNREIISDDGKFIGSEILPYQFVADLDLILIGVFLFFAFVSVLYALCKLFRPGMSKESQRIVLARHVLSIFVFIVAQLYVFVSFAFKSSPDLQIRYKL